jgi:hypothetical protein
MGRRAEDTRENRGDRGEDKDVEKTSPVMAHAPAAQYRCGVSVKPLRLINLTVEAAPKTLWEVVVYELAAPRT